MAAALDVTRGTVRGARIGLTGASTHAQRLTRAEAALIGQPLSDEALRAAAAIASSDVAVVNGDVHAGEDYRRAMIPVFTRRALEKARQRI